MQSDDKRTHRIFDSALALGNNNSVHQDGVYDIDANCAKNRNKPENINVAMLGKKLKNKRLNKIAFFFWGLFCTKSKQSVRH